MSSERIIPVYPKDEEELYRLIETKGSFFTVITFVAPWSANCISTKEMTRELLGDPEYKEVVFVELEAEKFPNVTKKYSVSSVPTIVFIRNQKEVKRLLGADVRNYAASMVDLISATSFEGGTDIATTVPKPSSQSADSSGSANEPLEQRLKRLINLSSVMLFMKGNPSKPKCGFSRQVIEILNATGVSYKTFDILEDEHVRQGLKDFSEWQTYPQLYVNGVLVGGLDIIRDMKEMGNLEDVLTGKESV